MRARGIEIASRAWLRRERLLPWQVKSRISERFSCNSIGILHRAAIRGTKNRFCSDFSKSAYSRAV
jgi:hypothetical protein